MDLLKAELERKRKATEALKSTAGAAEAENGAKSAARFIRQKDRIEMEERRRREMQEELDRQRRERRRAEEVAESQSKKQKQEAEQKTEEQKVDEIMHIPLREVKARLRAMRQPITYARRWLVCVNVFVRSCSHGPRIVLAVRVFQIFRRD